MKCEVNQHMLSVMLEIEAENQVDAEKLKRDLSRPKVLVNQNWVKSEGVNQTYGKAGGWNIFALKHFGRPTSS